MVKQPQNLAKRHQLCVLLFCHSPDSCTIPATSFGVAFESEHRLARCMRDLGASFEQGASIGIGP